MMGEIIRVAIREEQDIVCARQRARLIAELVGFERTDQARISTAVSEIARNAYLYGGGGEVAFAIEGAAPGQFLTTTVRDEGPGIADLDAVLGGTYASPTGMGLGIIGTRRLMDRFRIESAASEGTTVVFAKRLPAEAPEVTPASLERFAGELVKIRPAGALEEVSRQNQELLAAMEELRQREEELVQVNSELNETNRGVVVLYAELEDKAKQLELANSELESFAYSVSHDLRAPLRAIDGFSEIIYEDNVDRLDNETVANIERVRAAVQRMAALIDDLLALSRVIAAPLVHRKVDLSAMAREVGEELRAAEPDRNVDFAVSDDLKCSADPVLLRAVLVNLLTNAWKFTGRHPTACIEVAGAMDGARRAFCVRDDGAGFDPEHADKLFGAFQRLHSSEEFSGTGIGLATVQRIIRRHHGRVWAEGAVEGGATFWFSLPDVPPDDD
jgi:signal transduction histidine kinase